MTTITRRQSPQFPQITRHRRRSDYQASVRLPYDATKRRRPYIYNAVTGTDSLPRLKPKPCRKYTKIQGSHASALRNFGVLDAYIAGSSKWNLSLAGS